MCVCVYARRCDARPTDGEKRMAMATTEQTACNGSLYLCPYENEKNATEVAVMQLSHPQL